MQQKYLIILLHTFKHF